MRKEKQYKFTNLCIATT